MGRWMRKLINKQYGQAMAEFALTIPVFLLLVFGVIEMSRFFLVYSSVYTASREASRYGSSVGTGGISNYMNCAEIIQTAVRMGNFGGVQTDDVTVYYEKSPTAPEGERVSCDGVYQPKLGERLVVEIMTEFDSLLGIVPDLPVRAGNGRTIMMNIIIERTPEPVDKCKDFVSYEIATPIPSYKGEDNDIYDNILYVEIKNSSTVASYTIFQINDVIWNSTDNEPKLLEVRWESENEPIWITDNQTIEGYLIGNLPDFDIPEDGSINYWNKFLRNINPDSYRELEFVFDQDVDYLKPDSTVSDIELSFTLLMQHSYLPSDICNPGE